MQPKRRWYRDDKGHMKELKAGQKMPENSVLWCHEFDSHWSKVEAKESPEYSHKKNENNP